MVHRESPHLAWRCVLLSGPAGSGKTTVCRLGYRAMLAAWGHPAAAIDTDQLYLNVDARWELPYDDARNAMVLAHATQLALSLSEHGWQTVITCGNSLFEATDTAPILTRLTPIAEVYQVTLTTALPTVLTRCASTPSRNRPSSQPTWNCWHVSHTPARLTWTTQNMTPEQTLTELARLVDTGAGRLNCPP
jgi:hypothetical protein